MFAKVKKYENGKDVTANEQYREILRAYQTWFEKDRLICYNILYCMHDDLVGEFESYPTAEDIRDWLSIRFD